MHINFPSQFFLTLFFLVSLIVFTNDGAQFIIASSYEKFVISLYFVD